MPTCKACPAPISIKSKGGRCRPCANRARVWTREQRDQQSENSRAIWQRHLADPVNRQIAVEAGKRLQAMYPNEGILHHQPAAVAAAAEKRRGWCPPKYRELDDVYRSKGYRTDLRKAMIADQIAADERRRISEMTGLERQLHRLRNGARLVARVDTRVGYDYSLTGSSMG